MEVKTRGFLIFLSRDSSLPETVRRYAKFLLRHYLGQDDVILAGETSIEEQADNMPVETVGPVFSSSVT